MDKNPAWFTYDQEANAYYFAPSNRANAPYKTQREALVVIDIANDGSLAGVEILGLGRKLPTPKT